jgi:hypothetical protein
MRFSLVDGVEFRSQQVKEALIKKERILPPFFIWFAHMALPCGRAVAFDSRREMKLE